MECPVNFRFFKKNTHSIAALIPLLPAVELVHKPASGIMLYSFATMQAPFVFREVAQSVSDSIFIAGGPHPSARPSETLQYFDYVVIGEGEETLPELVDVLQNQGDVSSVKGIAFTDMDGKVVFTEKRKTVDLDSYPPFSPGVINSNIEISRGCPFGCSYCQTPQLFGHSMRHRSIDQIVKYCAYHRDIRFTSPNAFAYGSNGKEPRIDKIESLLKAIPEDRNIFFGTFPSEVRPEFISDGILEIVSKYCANTTLSMGGQSGSQRMLEIIHRGHAVEDIITGAEKCLEHGFVPVVDFIFGLPGETEEDQLESVKVIKWLTGKGARIHSHHFMPLPGTAFENAEPALLGREVEKLMGKLALDGKATGKWS
ncbi:MAG: TIGR04013 family B12-binding domain/radical SAM domain-containing protein [Candidatus Methanoperedens sp.]|jgi:B12-binding domain/radical SAM domain protein|nr:TIGR04013 family B12-binding domain/radical SAM domain-containing protein [Candidatus Methanoperedens sp.]PKL53788.1 MAG: TIGR04013 family B12-binding domain/radical SAM domain-containing protein [Candidatus Methanoperedenaceae archaeon HGW-Methanoperedenaceae-1]